MTITLGVPQIRGKSDVVNSYKAVTEIEPGYAVKRVGEDEVALFDGTGIPMGVSGYREIKGNKVVAVVEVAGGAVKIDFTGGF
jgi:hypothetical protein